MKKPFTAEDARILMKDPEYESVISDIQIRASQGHGFLEVPTNVRAVRKNRSRLRKNGFHVIDHMFSVDGKESHGYLIRWDI
jgi:selenocysteine-specific translation elongation factor